MSEHSFDSIYAAAIRETKARIRIVTGHIEGVPLHVTHELVALQVRMATELLAVGCVAAYDPLLATKSLHDEWHASKILKQIEKLHEDYFPVPIEWQADGAVNVIHPNPGGKYLTRADLLEMYDRAGNLLHVGKLNTILKQKARSPSLPEMREWFGRLHTLLNQHLIVRGDTHLMCNLGPLSSEQVEVVVIGRKGTSP